MRRAKWILTWALLATSTWVSAISPDHHEFEATLHAPFRGATDDARNIRLAFSFIDAQDPSTVAWRLDLRAQNSETILRQWVGEERLFRQSVEIDVPWDGRGEQQRVLKPGFYRLRLSAVAGEPTRIRAMTGDLSERVQRVLLEAADSDIEQEWDVHIGMPTSVRMPAFSPLPLGAAQKSAGSLGGLPYTVYFGNLHTQSNDSDGGGAIGSCSGSQSAQTGAFGPADGFVYARNHGLDFSAATEHNHYFDGSSGTSGSAQPAVAIARYQAGLSAAINSNIQHPDFLAIYGMEWGVINNGGHLNVFNSNELFAWEYNSSNQLIGDVFTPKSDYPALYATMRARNLIGQFNHPQSSGQFLVNGSALGYHVDGDEVMVLAEIQNTSAFSANTTETETGRSLYEGAFKKALEAGFHIAPATNQDNHCANWGASWTNRTGVLIDSSLTLSRDHFIDAMRARRVFATSDKNSQIVLTGNGRLMGERFDNIGALNLQVQFANTAGVGVAQVQILEGVPGRNGTVTVLSSAPTHSFTPSLGAHFYYARIVQNDADGKLLWSAPIWVNQISVDTAAPQVAGNVQGGRNEVMLNAMATDNIGVQIVEFYVDDVLRGQDMLAPYQNMLDSTVLTDGAHVLIVRARDAAANEGVSQPVNFVIDNSPLPDLMFTNSFE